MARKKVRNQRKYKLFYTPTFRKDVKRLKKRHIPTAELWQTIDIMLTKELLPGSGFGAHSLKDALQNWFACQPFKNNNDYRLIYRYEEQHLVLFRIGTHEEVYSATSPDVEI